MNKKLLIIIIAIFAVLAFTFTYYFLNKSKLSPVQLENCNTLSYSSPQAKNIVFFSTKQQAQEYSDYLLSHEPFSKNKQAFNFYYIASYFPECELYQEKAILCYSRELVKQASSCPNDYIIVIDTKPSPIRSSSYMNTLSLNSNHNKNVLLHEIAHALAFLADEYVPSALPSKSKNCVSDCSKFSVSDGCFEGCSKNEYFRSIQSGVMRTLSSSDYGTLNNQLILSYLPLSTKITTSIISEDIDCENGNYYLIEGKYQDNQINIISQNIEQGCLGSNGIGDFEYNLILTDNTAYQESFNPELIFTDNETGGSVEISKGPFYLKLPIIEKAKTLEISKTGELLAQINLQGLDAKPCRK